MFVAWPTVTTDAPPAAAAADASTQREQRERNEPPQCASSESSVPEASDTDDSMSRIVAAALQQCDGDDDDEDGDHVTQFSRSPDVWPWHWSLSDPCSSRSVASLLRPDQQHQQRADDQIDAAVALAAGAIKGIDRARFRKLLILVLGTP